MRTHRDILSSASTVFGTGLLLGGLFLCTVGCDSPPPTKIPSSGASSGSTDSAPSADSDSSSSTDNCEELLTQLLSMLSPENLGISSDLDTATAIFEQWSGECGGATTAGDFTPSPMDQQLVSAPELERFASQRYDHRDGAHVRNCQLYKSIADRITADSKSDRQRAVAAFDYVIRNIELAEPKVGDVPISLYEVLLFGHGRAEDRAWLFANLLRQLKIDAVVLIPRGVSPPATADAPAESAAPAEASPPTKVIPQPFLVGAVVDDGVCLFDMRLGWAIPSANDPFTSPSVTEPATLAEILATPDLLRPLDADDEHRYPLTVEQLKSLEVGLIGETEFWLPRQYRFQSALSGAQSVIVADPLGDLSAGPGLQSRIVKAGEGVWTAADVKLWDFPARRLEQYEHPTPETAALLKTGLSRFNAALDPVRGSLDEKNLRVTIAPSKQLMLKSRLKQLLGQNPEAIRTYQTIRLDSSFWIQLFRANYQPTNPELTRKEVETMHLLAHDDAYFWVALAQYEQEDYAAVIATVNDYIGSYRGQGIWSLHALWLMRMAMAKSGLTAVAIVNMRNAPPEAPDWYSTQVLLRRLREIEQRRQAAPAEKKAGE